MSSPNSSSGQKHALPSSAISGQFIQQAVVFCVFVLVTLYAVAKNNVILKVGIITLPFFFILMGHPDFWFMLVICLASSGIIVPFVQAGGLAACDFLTAGLLILTIARLIISKNPFPYKDPANRYVWIFLVIVVVTMFHRGIGLYRFGSEMVGGTFYIKLLIALAMVLLARNLLLTPQQWKKALICYCLAPLPFTMADLTFILSGGRFYQVYQFFSYGANATGSVIQMADTGLTRLASVQGIAETMIVLAYVLFSRRDKSLVNVWRMLLAGFGIVMAFWTGSRVSLIGAIVLIFALEYLFRGMVLKWRYGIRMVTWLLVCWVLLIFFARLMPLPFQRAASMVPFVKVSAIASEGAQNTLEWRIELWKKALTEELPRYWLVGKGVAFSLQDALFVMSNPDPNMRRFEGFMVTRNYHNGPISVLLQLGVPGLVAALGFMFVGAKHHMHLTRGAWNSSTLSDCHRIILAIFLARIIQFLFLHGDISPLASLLFLLALLEASARADMSVKAQPVALNGAPLKLPMPRTARYAGALNQI